MVGGDTATPDNAVPNAWSVATLQRLIILLQIHFGVDTAASNNTVTNAT